MRISEFASFMKLAQEALQASNHNPEDRRVIAPISGGGNLTVEITDKLVISFGTLGKYNKPGIRATFHASGHNFDDLPLTPSLFNPIIESIGRPVSRAQIRRERELLDAMANLATIELNALGFIESMDIHTLVARAPTYWDQNYSLTLRSKHGDTAMIIPSGNPQPIMREDPYAPHGELAFREIKRIRSTDLRIDPIESMRLCAQLDKICVNTILSPAMQLSLRDFGLRKAA